MANPNIASISNIYGKTVGLSITTSSTSILTNSSGSNKIFKVNSLIVSNIDGTNSADVTAFLRKNGSTDFYLAYTITVPADSTLVVISKDSGIFLEENDSIFLFASANSDLQAICSYEDYS
jgi:hypothetical protein